MRRVEGLERPCLECGVVFRPEPYKAKTAKFCGHPCRIVSMQRLKPEKFWHKVQKSDGCWEWQGCIMADGYGCFGANGMGHGRPVAHRVSWVFHFGDVPQGLLVCHHCDNRRCVRPDHLFLGTPKANMQDAVSKGRMARGERAGAAKMTSNQVLQIRDKHSLMGISYAELSREYGIGETTVSRAANGLTWKHLPMGNQ